MESMFGLLVVATAGSVAYLLLSWRFRQRTQAWQNAARAAGMTNLRMVSTLGWETKLTGEVGSLRVTLESYHRGRQEHGTRVIVGGLRHGIYELTVRPESVGTSLEKAFGDREIELGDEGFDGAAYVQGSPALVRALFDAPTRRLMEPLLRGRLPLVSSEGERVLAVHASIGNGEVRVEVRERPFESLEPWLQDVLARVIELGRRLLRPEDLPTTMAANTRREPLPGVRLANLQLLVREYPAHPATRDVLREGLEDKSLVVRAQAAIELGSEGQETLLEIAGRDDAPDALAARAIAALGEAFPATRAIATLQQALDTGRTSVARACVNALARSGIAATAGLGAMSRVLAEAGPDLAVAAARALGASPGTSAERALIAALGHESGDVRVAAAESLGRSGTPVAVVPLKEAASSHPFDGTLRRAARQAIAEIQSRVSGASPGQLSMAAEVGGEVSLADEDRRGQLSLESSVPSRGERQP